MNHVGRRLVAAGCVGLLFLIGGCSSLPAPNSPLGDVAPGWDPSSPRRQYMGERSLPVDPLGNVGYLPPNAFRFDEWCQTNFLGALVSESEAQACVRERCLLITHPGLYPRSRQLTELPFTDDEEERCLTKLSSLYDALNNAFEEPVLRGLPEEVTVYRLYVFGCFHYAHKMVRVVKNAQGLFLVEKRLEAYEMPGQGRLSWQRQRRLQASEWSGLVERIARAEYWQLPPQVRTGVQFDGEHYELEGLQSGKPHMVTFGMVDGALSELAAYLLRLTQSPR
jgi:hypothetical protein